MEYTVEGTLKTASKLEAITTKNGPKQKRRFILETNEEYPQMLEFELFGDKVKLLDDLHTDDYVKIKFDIRGREWTNNEGKKRIFMTLSPWAIDKVKLNGGNAEAVDVPDDDFGKVKTDDMEDLPF